MGRAEGFVAIVVAIVAAIVAVVIIIINERAGRHAQASMLHLLNFVTSDNMALREF